MVILLSPHGLKAPSDTKCLLLWHLLQFVRVLPRYFDLQLLDVLPSAIHEEHQGSRRLVDSKCLHQSAPASWRLEQLLFNKATGDMGNGIPS